MNTKHSPTAETGGGLRLSGAPAFSEADPGQLGDLGLWRRLRRTPAATLGGTVTLLLILTALIGPMIWPLDPLKQNLLARNKPPGWIDSAGVQHALGTDQVGRDLVARLLMATGVSLVVGALSTLAAGVLGIAAGAISGYFGGKTDSLIMRIVDVQMSFPFILLAIVWSIFVGTGLWSVVTVVALRGWVTYARIIRSRILSVREAAFVEAARVIGAPTPRILWYHVLPQTTASIIVLSAIQLGTAVLFESTLGFLGLGIQPPVATLGNMLADGRGYLSSAWWLVMCPGALLTVMVLAFNTCGDGLRDLLDPRTRDTARA